jgi:tetratricopeptide (TPR) repeat protein
MIMRNSRSVFWFLSRMAIPILLLASNLQIAAQLPEKSAETETPGPADAGRFCQLLEAHGVIEMLNPETGSWVRIMRGHQIPIPCRIRTGADGRAGIQFSNKSILRLAPGTGMEIADPRPEKSGAFKLLQGRLYFFNREKPGSIDFSTPLATGAIRGTEFVLSADKFHMVDSVALVEGAVELSFMDQTIAMTPGQILSLNKEGGYRLEAMDGSGSVIQWVLHYPQVIHPGDLDLTPDEQVLLAGSLQSALTGNIRAAVGRLPMAFQPGSDDARAWLAGLYLSAGLTDQAMAYLNHKDASTNPLIQAVTELFMAVNFASEFQIKPVATASGSLARSYTLQSRFLLQDALDAARKSVSLAPDFGFAWIRIAELSLMLDQWNECEAALNKASILAPDHPLLHTIKGFFLLAAREFSEAESSFDQAISLHHSMGLPWLGKSLCAFHTGRGEAGQKWIQAAVALEPQRSIFRSYLAKAFAENGEDPLAGKEFARAIDLDANDPTPHHYASIWHMKNNNIIQSISELEKAMELNDNRAIFRSRLQLDLDESIRSADLASIYQLAGLPIPGFRRASRSIQNSYTEYASHLFAAQSYRALEDPYAFDLNYESMRQSEWMIANLLAPGAGLNLSQAIIEQRSINLLSSSPRHALVSSTWRDNGDWNVAASAYGSGQKISYAIDYNWQTIEGFLPNTDLDRESLTLRTKYFASPSDSFYFELGHDRRQGGDPVNRADPRLVDQTFQYTERQFPILLAGYVRRWNPSHTTLLIGGRIEDQFNSSTDSLNPLFLSQSGGQFTGVSTVPLASGRLQSEFSLSSTELQHIWAIPEFTAIAGIRYQSGDVEAAGEISRPFSGPLYSEMSSMEFSRFNTYIYTFWEPLTAVTLTSGISFDDISFPYNSDILPLSSSHQSYRLWRRSLVSISNSRITSI